MKKKQEEIGSEDMQGLSQRVVELLAAAAVKLATEGSNTLNTPSQSETSSMLPAKGRVPFGQNEAEARWIRCIKELAAQGYSSEKIAKQLNQEDHESKRAGKWSRTAVWRILQKIKDKGATHIL